MLLLERDEDNELVLDATDLPIWPKVALLPRIISKFCQTKSATPHGEEHTSCKGEKKNPSLAPRPANWSSRT